MNDPHATPIRFPENLSDEAAASLLDFLYDLANALESQYAGQLQRYYHGTDERQADFWESHTASESNPPF